MNYPRGQRKLEVGITQPRDQIPKKASDGLLETWAWDSRNLGGKFGALTKSELRNSNVRATQQPDDPVAGVRGGRPVRPLVLGHHH